MKNSSTFVEEQKWGRPGKEATIMTNFSFCLTDAVGIVKTAMESNTTKLFHYDRNQAVEILRLQNNIAAR